MGRFFYSSSLQQTAYQAVVFLTGLLLVVAATLKFHDQSDPWFAASVLLPLAEVLLGVWLWSGIRRKFSLWTALAVFIAFSAINFAQYRSGAWTCGCLGDVSIGPRKMLLVDMGIATALASCLLLRKDVEESSSSGIWFRIAKSSAVAPICCGFVFATDRAFSSTSVSLVRASSVQQWTPSEWVGKPLTILDNIDIGNELSSGLWGVLIYDHQCAACELSLIRYEELAAEYSNIATAPSIAFVEKPPFDSDGSLRSRVDVYGRLSPSEDIYFPTPLALLIDDGVVLAVFDQPTDTAMLREIWGSGGSDG